MPEGDTIHRAANRIGAILQGQVPEQILTPHPRHRADRWPQLLRGRSVRSVDAHGKHLFLRFEGELTLHSHLRMTGIWDVGREGRRWRRSPQRAWLVLRSGGWEVVEFDGPVLELMSDARTRSDPRLAALGQDVLGESFDMERFLARLRSDDPTRPIADALLNQRTVAGIGNLWKAELCFAGAIDPWRPLAAVGDEEAISLLELARERMSQSVRDGPRARTRAVYKRAGLPCPRLRHHHPPARSGREQPLDLLVSQLPDLNPTALHDLALLRGFPRTGVEVPWMADESASRERPSPKDDRRLPPVLLALTLTTGLIDAASYLGLGHVFTANMTGNIVLLGFGLANAGGLPVVAPLISLGAFLLGAAAGGRLGVGVAKQHERIVLLAVGSEVALLAIAAAVAVAIHVRVGSGSAYAIIALVALAMGIRNAIVRKLAVPDLTTTVLTLTLTGIAADTAAGTMRRSQSLRRLLAVAAMLLGAFVGALLEKHSLSLPLAVAAAAGAASFGAYVLGLLPGATASR
ncbi:MAG TPA: DUF1275 family protein [Solirubrobacteraceae bacterium]|jgi:endonuclease-8|nr:DUF1275 family protein [Solirubrobacteraceae bacterium]